MSVYWDLFFPGDVFYFPFGLCVEADTLVYFHSPITPTATASHAVVLSRILQVRTIRGWYALHRLFLPSHGDGRDSKTDGDVASVLAAPMYRVSMPMA